MIEIVFVCSSVLHLYDIQCCQFGHDEHEQSTPLKVNKTFAWCLTRHYLVQLILDAFSTDDLDAVGIAFQGGKRLVLYHEIELGSKTYAPQHPQWVVAEGDVWI